MNTSAHRSLAEIDAAITSAAALLNALHQERRAARQADIDAVCAMFDTGKNPAEIAKERGVGRFEVVGILYRAGRTVRGREAVRARIKAISQGVSA